MNASDSWSSRTTEREMARIGTASTLRIHPERWGGLLMARAGMVGAMIGGTALFVQLIAVIC